MRCKFQQAWVHGPYPTIDSSLGRRLKPTGGPRNFLDAFLVMPNHVHGILGIMDLGKANRAKDFSPLQRPATVPGTNTKEQQRGKMVKTMNKARISIEPCRTAC